MQTVSSRPDHHNQSDADDATRTKNNPVLVGEPGVGKSAIAEGLAQRIVNRDVPASLIGRVFALGLGSLTAGASHKGEYEERVVSLFSTKSPSPPKARRRSRCHPLHR